MPHEVDASKAIAAVALRAAATKLRRVTDLSPHERLLDEAVKAFRAKGYGAANLGRIATAAGMSKSTIYRFVDSKADLFAQVVEDGMRRNNLTALAAAPAPGEDLPETLRRALLTMTALALSPDGIASDRLINRERQQFPELAALHDRALAPFLQGLVGLLAAGRDAGRLAITDPHWAAIRLVDITLAEARRQALSGGDPAPEPAQQAKLVDDALELFLKGAEAR